MDQPDLVDALDRLVSLHEAQSARFARLLASLTPNQFICTCGALLDVENSRCTPDGLVVCLICYQDDRRAL